MSIKSQINSILSQEMDRKGFIRNVFFALFAMTSLGTLLKALSRDSTQTNSTSHGFGDAAYGGPDDGKR